MVTVISMPGVRVFGRRPKRANAGHLDYLALFIPDGQHDLGVAVAPLKLLHHAYQRYGLVRIKSVEILFFSGFDIAGGRGRGVSTGT